MDIELIKQMLEMGFPAVILILYILERRERMRIQAEYTDSLRHIANLPPVPDGEPHEFTVKWNGHTTIDDSQAQQTKTP